MKRCILTGLGGRGRHWLSAVQKRDDVEVVAGVEPNEANQVIAIEKGMAPDKIFPSLEDALQHVDSRFRVGRNASENSSFSRRKSLRAWPSRLR